MNDIDIESILDKLSFEELMNFYKKQDVTTKRQINKILLEKSNSGFEKTRNDLYINRIRNLSEEKILENIILNLNNLKLKNDFNFKYKQEWMFLDKHHIFSTKHFKILTLNYKDQPIAITAIDYSLLNKTLNIHFLQGVHNSRLDGLKIPKNWFDIIIQSLILSSFKYISNLKTKKINLKYLDLEKIRKGQKNVLSEKQLITIKKIRDKYFNKNEELKIQKSRDLYRFCSFYYKIKSITKKQKYIKIKKNNVIPKFKEKNKSKINLFKRSFK
jgi:hypothetical protein